jgi:hypothetical protein
MIGRDAPDTVLAGYPANRISGQSKNRIPNIRLGRIPDIRPDNWPNKKINSKISCDENEESQIYECSLFQF